MTRLIDKYAPQHDIEESHVVLIAATTEIVLAGDPVTGERLRSVWSILGPAASMLARRALDTVKRRAEQAEVEEAPSRLAAPLVLLAA